MNKVIGFLGIDVADTILYLSRICLNFGSKVLILDYSESDRLRCSVPVDTQVNLEMECYDYRGVDYSKKNIKEELEEYDIVLMNLGFVTSEYAKNCDYKIYTTDLHKNSLEKLYHLVEPSGDARQLVIRKRRKEEHYVKGELRRIVSKMNPDLMIEQYYKGTDDRTRFQSEFQDRFTFYDLSQDFKDYLSLVTKMIYPQVPKKEFMKYMKRAERGE